MRERGGVCVCVWGWDRFTHTIKQDHTDSRHGYRQLEENADEAGATTLSCCFSTMLTMFTQLSCLFLPDVLGATSILKRSDTKLCGRHSSLQLSNHRGILQLCDNTYSRVFLDEPAACDPNMSASCLWSTSSQCTVKIKMVFRGL